MQNKTKRAIRERMAQTGESYSTARMHFLGHPSEGGTAVSRMRGIVDRVIALASRTKPPEDMSAGAGAFRVVRIADVPSDPEGELRRDAIYQHLLALDDDDLRKVEVLAYVGREHGTDVLDLAGDLGRDTHQHTAENLWEKSRVLAEYLKRGLEAAREQGVDLDAVWPSPPAGGEHLFKVRAFQGVHERDSDQAAVVISGVLVEQAIEFRMDGVPLGRLRTNASGRDQWGPWAAVDLGPAKLDTGIAVRIEPSFDEFINVGAVDGLEIDLFIGGEGRGTLSIDFNAAGQWNGGGLPARTARLDGVGAFEA